MSQADIVTRVNATRADLLEAVDREEPLTLVEAPPGSGKTRLITEAAALARARDRRVAIAAQTNNQANDICRRLAADFPQFQVIRFAAGRQDPVDLGSSVEWVYKTSELPDAACIAVGTTAKWGLVRLENYMPFDLLLVDEAWQMAWADFMLAGRQVASRFVMVGDPGQISPVVTVDVSRWATAPAPPQLAAPEVVRRMLAEGKGPGAVELQLPSSRRLPHDSIPLVRLFYEFEFDSWSEPGARRLAAKQGNGEAADPGIDLLNEVSIAALTLPTPAEGPPLEEDRDVAALAASAAARLLERRSKITLDDESRTLRPEDIGIVATHRVMNTRIHQSLPAKLQNVVRVDTPERWQGLERPMMICVHPISGVTSPSGFDLETGRLCVMASRHQVGLLVVSRDHIGGSLDEFSPAAEQGVGLPDAVGLGHARHSDFWDSLGADGLIAATA